MSYSHLRHAVPVVPSDSQVLPVTERLYVGVTGDLVVLAYADTAPVTLKNAAVGWHDLRVIKVLATGTTATSIVAWR